MPFWRVLADADVVLVIDSQHTRIRAAKEAKNQMEQLGIEIKGVILNQINPRDEAGQYGYKYGYGYYYSAGQVEEERKGLRRLLPWK